MTFVTREGKLLRDALGRWLDTESYRLAAALSYYALLSLVPVLILGIGLVELVLGESAELRLQLLRWTTASGSATVEAAVREALPSISAGSGITIAIGAIGSLIGASGVFAELDTALNRVYRSETKAASMRRALLELLWDRMTAIALVGVSCLLVLGVALLGTLWDIVARDHLPTLVGRLLSGAVGLVLLTATFTLCLHVIPARKVPWTCAVHGAAWTSVLLFLVRPAFGWLILTTTDYAAYGALGAILSTLLWMLIVAMVFLFGACVAAMAGERAARPREEASPRSASVRAGEEAPPVAHWQGHPHA